MRQVIPTGVKARTSARSTSEAGREQCVLLTVQVWIRPRFCHSPVVILGFQALLKKYLGFLWALMSAHVIDSGNRLASLVIDLGLRWPMSSCACWHIPIRMGFPKYIFRQAECDSCIWNERLNVIPSPIRIDLLSWYSDLRICLVETVVAQVDAVDSCRFLFKDSRGAIHENIEHDWTIDTSLV